MGGSIVKLTQFLEQLPKSGLIVLAVLLMSVIGIADYLTGYEISFSTFYLIAVALATWFVGKTPGVILALLSVASEFLGDRAAGVHYSHAFVPVWNAVIAMAFYGVVIWLLTSLHSLQMELENRVQKRTEALTAQMAERQRLEKELLEISEREQRRIGHDLHDSLCQHLTGTALAGQVLEEKLAMKSLPETIGAKQIVTLVEEAIELTRSLSRGLYPVTLEDAGLRPAFEELAAVIEERFQVTCQCECAQDLAIADIAVVTHLYRIAQESISNAIKHGRAQRILLRLEASDNLATLTVEDNGTGLAGNWRESRGMGLRIMAHRATMIGAEFSVESPQTGGTRVRCSLPNFDR